MKRRHGDIPNAATMEEEKTDCVRYVRAVVNTMDRVTREGRAAFVPSLALRQQRPKIFGPSCKTRVPTRASARRGPQTLPPDYSNIDANPFNRVFTKIFLSKLERELGEPATLTGYAGVTQVVKALAARHRDPVALRQASERVLLSLFPSWLPPAFAVLFSRPMPLFAAWINAVVTVGVTQWLMGPSHLAEDGATVDIERCRYLEDTGCVGICLNSCKAATESFFDNNMGIDLHIEPNLDDYSCKFNFGKTPPCPSEDPMYQEPCLSGCKMASEIRTTPCQKASEAAIRK